MCPLGVYHLVLRGAIGLQLFLGAIAADLALLIGNAHLVSVTVGCAVELPAKLIVGFQGGLCTARPQALQPVLIRIFIACIHLTLIGGRVIEIMLVVKDIALEAAIGTSPFHPFYAGFTVYNDRGLLAEAMGFHSFLFAAVAYAHSIVTVRFINADIAIGAMNGTNQSATGWCIFFSHMLGLEIGDIGGYLIAVGIGNDTFIGIILIAGILRNGNGKGIGFCALGNEPIIIGNILHDFPIRSVVHIIPLIGQGACPLCRNGENTGIACRVQGVSHRSIVNIRNLGNHTLGLLQDQDILLRVKAADRTDTVFVIHMGCLVCQVRSILTEAAGTPMVGFADFPGILGCGRV